MQLLSSFYFKLEVGDVRGAFLEADGEGDELWNAPALTILTREESVPTSYCNGNATRCFCNLCILVPTFINVI